MRRFAKIKNGTVATIRTDSPNEECTVEIPSQVETGWREPLAGTEEWRRPLVDRAELLAQLASRRWEEEVAPVEVVLSDARSFAVASDRESRSVLNQFLTVCSLIPGTTDSWKTADGSYQFINQQFASEIALQIAGHVRECFAREKAVRDIISATDDEGLSDVLPVVEAFWEPEEVE